MFILPLWLTVELSQPQWLSAPLPINTSMKFSLISLRETANSFSHNIIKPPLRPSLRTTYLWSILVQRCRHSVGNSSRCVSIRNITSKHLHFWAFKSARTAAAFCRPRQFQLSILIATKKPTISWTIRRDKKPTHHPAEQRGCAGTEKQLLQTCVGTWALQAPDPLKQPRETDHSSQKQQPS